MNKLGYEECQKQAKEGEPSHSWAKEKDYLSPYVEQEEFRSRSVAAIDLDDKYDANALIKVLDEQKAANGIGSYRKLGRNQFRIAFFHNVSYEDLENLQRLFL